MEILKISALVLLSVSALIILVIALFSKKLIKTLILNAILGIAALVLINLSSYFTGVKIPVNEWTVSSGAIFGAPAVIGLLVMSLI